jgi:hypothetical protein
MARTKLNQRSANRVDVPMGATGGRPPPKFSIAVLVLSILTAIWAAAMLTPFGRVGYYYLFAYSEYYMGVITLVSLSITIMVGLVATDRLVLSIRQRVLLQSAHRTAGIIAVASLVVHIWTKFIEQHIRAIDIVIPFAAPYNTVYVGLGTLSGWIMMLVMWTGLARSKFIGRGKPWMWRSIHAISYLMWPLALVHGLAAGRKAAPWVIVSYVICVLLVLVGLAVRLSVSLNRRKDFASTPAGTIKPAGSLVPTQAPAPKKRRSRRAEPERGAPPEPWVPAAAPRSSAAPVSGAPADVTPYARYMEEDPRGRRYATDETHVGMPRPGRERYDERTKPMSRRALELDGPPRDDPRYDTVETPMPRGWRRAEEQYDEAPRGRRYADEDDYAPRPRRAAEDMPRGRRYDEEMAETPMPRGRRRAEEQYPEPPRGRRYAEEERYDEVPRQRGYREPDARTTGEFRTGDYRGWSEEPPPSRSRRASRYAEDEEAAPRTRRDRGADIDRADEDAAHRYPGARRDRGADIDRADSGRHSRSEFVDLAPPADPWRGQADPNYMEPDETPTLVDMASRRARRQERQDVSRSSGRGARRGGGRSAAVDDLDDPSYWRQLRGEAQ